MKRLLRSCSACLLLGLAFATSGANAASHPFGNIMPADIPGDLVVLTQDSGLDTIFEGGVAFADEYSFDLVDSGTPGLTVSVLFEIDNAFTALSAVPLTVALYRRGTGGDTLLASETGQAVVFTRLLATSLTEQQQYLLTIAGTAPSEFTAGYSGKLTVVAIPEPSSVALLLAGLALVTTTFPSTRWPRRPAV